MARRDYRHSDGGRLPGATTVLGVLDKPALLSWAARVAADTAARAHADGQTLDAAIAAGIRAPTTKRDKAADLGTMAHDIVERAHTKGEAVTELVTPETEPAIRCAERVLRHLAREFIVTHSEVAYVVDEVGPLRGYGGTLDLVVEYEGKRYLADLKTGKRAYAESVIPQLAAYLHLWQTHNPTLPIDGGLVLSAPVDIDPFHEGDGVTRHWIDLETLKAGFFVFSGALTVYRYKNELKFKEDEK
jgi:hypothetical protein